MKKIEKPDVCRGVVFGNMLEITGNDFLQAAKIIIQEEQDKLDPDNAVISFACNAVRLWREHEAAMTRRP